MKSILSALAKVLRKEQRDVKEEKRLKTYGCTSKWSIP